MNRINVQRNWKMDKKKYVRNLNVFNKMGISDVDNNHDYSHRSPITIKHKRQKKNTTAFNKKKEPKKG